ncbi:hypothetical protein KAR91_10335 [Candidatus Pacearchaeota archaeon]|nr:hypothetical protein [Candidatus Pacearchaeota archaeon]
MIWVLVWAVFIFVLGWEILALATKEKYFPTISRMVWKIIEKYPKTEWPILILTAFIGIAITTWLVIHFSGECALGIC